jgi:hypothetical protein
MANENKRRFIDVEDYSAATTTDVIPNGQVRWFNKVTGYNAAEIIELVGDGSTTIASLARRQWLTDTAQTLYGVKTLDSIPVLPASNPTTANQAARKQYVDDNVPGIGFTFDVENTTSGDVAATTPSSPGDGDQWTVVNSGTGGNHVTGLPGSISLGDGKTITFKYDSTNATWRYEDVIIDEYSAADGVTADVTHSVKKWSGGMMRVQTRKAATVSDKTGTFPEAFNSIDESPVSGGSAGQQVIQSYTTTTVAMRTTNSAGSVSIGEMTAETVGRWKA